MFVLQRQTGDRTVPATSDDRTGGALAIWQASPDGKMWIDELTAGGHALYLGGNGYPHSYSAPAAKLIPYLYPSPPHVREFWSHDEGDVLTGDGPRQTKINATLIAECDPDEWLLVEVWDES